jgi:hypothetical protein
MLQRKSRERRLHEGRMSRFHNAPEKRALSVTMSRRMFAGCQSMQLKNEQSAWRGSSWAPASGFIFTDSLMYGTDYAIKEHRARMWVINNVPLTEWQAG